MNVLLRALLIVLWFAAANSSEAYALFSKNRVGNFFEPALETSPAEAMQVPEWRQDNLPTYDGCASGSTLWSKFDPDGLAEVWVNGQVVNRGHSPGGFQLLVPATAMAGGARPWTGSSRGDVAHWRSSTGPKLQMAIAAGYTQVAAMTAGYAVAAVGPVAVAKEVGGEVVEEVTGVPMISPTQENGDRSLL